MAARFDVDGYPFFNVSYVRGTPLLIPHDHMYSRDDNSSYSTDMLYTGDEEYPTYVHMVPRVTTVNAEVNLDATVSGYCLREGSKTLEVIYKDGQQGFSPLTASAAILANAQAIWHGDGGAEMATFLRCLRLIQAARQWLEVCGEG